MHSEEVLALARAKQLVQAFNFLPTDPHSVPPSPHREPSHGEHWIAQTSANLIG